MELYQKPIAESCHYISFLTRDIPHDPIKIHALLVFENKKFSLEMHSILNYTQAISKISILAYAKAFRMG
jgi:hypothetical protein